MTQSLSYHRLKGQLAYSNLFEAVQDSDIGAEPAVANKCNLEAQVILYMVTVSGQRLLMCIFYRHFCQFCRILRKCPMTTSITRYVKPPDITSAKGI